MNWNLVEQVRYITKSPAETNLKSIEDIQTLPFLKTHIIRERPQVQELFGALIS